MKCKHCGATIYQDAFEFPGEWYSYPIYKINGETVQSAEPGYYCVGRDFYYLGHDPEGKK